MFIIFFYSLYQFICYRNLYESVQKYDETWRRVNELETPEQGQSRFRNRGGKLLLEEKERKVARKRLERLEQTIVKLGEEYAQQYHEEFTYNGLPLEEYLLACQEGRDVNFTRYIKVIIY